MQTPACRVCVCDEVPCNPFCQNPYRLLSVAALKSLAVAALKGANQVALAPHLPLMTTERAGEVKSRKRKLLLARLISRGQVLGFSRKGYVPCCQAIRSHCRVAFSPCPRVSVSPRLPVSLSPCLSPWPPG